MLIPNCDKIVPGMLMAAARLKFRPFWFPAAVLAAISGGEEVSCPRPSGGRHT